MELLFNKSCIHCSFDKLKDVTLSEDLVTIEIFFAETKNLLPEFKVLKEYIDKNDQLRADKLFFEKDRITYLMCHTLLRVFLSAKLKIKSQDLIITKDRNNKPWLQNKNIYFNITHSREAFAFAISEQVRIGIDLEKIDKRINYLSIMKSFFSEEETKFVLNDYEDPNEKFFLLWTRKEALLKALGTGIIDNLINVEVFRNENYLERNQFNNIIDNSFFCDHFIYSDKVLNNYISIATPSKAKFIFYNYSTLTDLLKCI